jgi:fatty acid desaturase
MTAGPTGAAPSKGAGVEAKAAAKKPADDVRDAGHLGKAHACPVPPLSPPEQAGIDVKTIRAAIPAELFERSAFWSFVHLGVDFLKVGLTFAAMLALDRSALPLAAKALLWPLAWYVQGAFFTGVWVVAHECGHQAFSASRTLNDAVGLVLVSGYAGVPVTTERARRPPHAARGGRANYPALGGAPRARPGTWPPTDARLLPRRGSVTCRRRVSGGRPRRILHARRALTARPPRLHPPRHAPSRPRPPPQHSALLVPYHAWAISHGHHHSYTCSLEDDEVFVPAHARDFALAESIADTPLANLWGVVQMLLFGWCVAQPAAAAGCGAAARARGRPAREGGAVCGGRQTRAPAAPGDWVAVLSSSSSLPSPHPDPTRTPPLSRFPPHPRTRRPGYLIANYSGPKKYKGKPNSHFNPQSALFSAQQAYLIVRSNYGLVLAAAALAYATSVFGARNMVFYYVVPYLITNAWLVTITFLQHTDTFVPHYRGEAFTWLRGALATVDRDYGWFLNDAHHHIADSHVAHHLFSTMPWYNAVKATPYIKAAVGKYYLSDDTSVPAAIYRAWSQCKYVDDEGGVVFFRSPTEFKAAKAAGTLGKKKAQ